MGRNVLIEALLPVIIPFRCRKHERDNYLETKVCRACGTEKAIEEYTLNGVRRRNACKVCEAARVRAYYAATPGYQESVKATVKLRRDPVAWAEHLKRRAEVAAVVPDTRVCNKCAKELPLAEFNRHPNGKHGRGSVCRDCKINEGRDARKTGRWPSFTSEGQRSVKLMKLYGISAEEYDARLAAQGGVCALCGTDDPGTKSGKHMVVDHDHDDGKIRGLLCSTCNIWLGNYQQLLERAGEAKLMRYLHPAPIVCDTCHGTGWKSQVQRSLSPIPCPDCATLKPGDTFTIEGIDGEFAA